MLDKTKILVVKTDKEIIISFDGCKLMKPIDKFKDMTKEEIIDWFWQEIGGENVE